MKRIFGLVLALVMLVSVFAVLPAFAEDNAEGKWNVLLNEGIVLNYYEGDVKVDSVKVAAKEMAVSQTVNGKTTSVEAYLKGLIAGEYGENTKALAAALLNYGAAAYEYFSVNDGYVGTPVDGEPVTDTTALKGAEAPEASVTDPDGIYVGASLVLDGTMKLRFYFTGNGLEAEYQDNNQTATNKDGYCYFDVPVMPYAMTEAVTIVTGETTVTYAPINYLQAKADDAALAEMVASIYAYGVAAEAYYVTDGCEHGGDITIEIIKPSTMFTEGVQNNYCDICDKYVSTTPAETTNPKVTVLNPDISDDGDIVDSVTLKDVLKEGDHFYPTEQNPNGKGLYVEFSFLWNTTLANVKTENAYAELGRIDDGSSRFSPCWFAFTDGSSGMWCQYAGGFENLGATEHVYGPVIDEGGEIDDYPNIGDYGWHRIGLEYIQTTEVADAPGNMLVNLYIDGVLASSYYYDCPESLLLYTKNSNGTYNDPSANAKIRFYRIDKAATTGENAYFIIGDVYATAGDGFVINVAPDDTPFEGVCTPAEGVELDANVFFEVRDEDDCLAGNHTWATLPTVDFEPNCGNDGQKSIKCTICDAINPDSIIEIPTDGQHVWVNVVVVSKPTLFSTGLKTGTCSACGEDFSEVLPKTDADVVVTDPETSNDDIMVSQKLTDILKGDHFYPTEQNPNGKGLYLEFSMLWNETLANIITKEAYAELGRIDDGSNRFSPCWFAFTDDCSGMWCQYAGGFENLGATEHVYGPVIDEGGEIDDYPNIGDYGWHRIGLEYIQTTEVAGAPGNMLVNLYIDGVLASSYYYDCPKSLLLYTKNSDGTYNDPDAKATLRYYRIDNGATSEENAYFIIGDVSVSVGTRFVMNVKPNETVVGGTYTTEDGTDIDASVYFDIYESGACADNKHAYAPVPTVDFEPTCTDAGQKSYKCAFCDAVKTEEIPSEGKHVMSNGVIITVPTAFSEGVMTGTCSACGVAFSEAVPKTEIYTEVVTSSFDRNYKWYCEPHYIKDLTDEENHFYDENNSLYIEYSLLVNDSFDVDLKHDAKSSWFIFGTVGVNSAAEDTWEKLGWFHRDANDTACPYVGGVEPNGDVAKFYADNGIVEKQGNYYVMKDELYYGWHRFGVQIHQDYEIVDGEAEYTVTVTVFIDGVRIMDIAYGGWDEDNLLYTVKVDGEVLVFTDNKDSNIQVTAFVMQRLVPKSSSAKVYAPVADVHVTCGSGFVMPVEKLDTPTEGTYSPASGVTLDADQHFTYVD